jgi:hypothetical protein
MYIRGKRKESGCIRRVGGYGIAPSMPTKQSARYLQELQSRALNNISSYEESPLSPLGSTSSTTLAQNNVLEQSTEISATVPVTQPPNDQRSAPILAELRKATTTDGSIRQSGASVSIESAQFAIGDEYSMHIVYAPFGYLC